MIAAVNTAGNCMTFEKLEKKINEAVRQEIVKKEPVLKKARIETRLEDSDFSDLYQIGDGISLKVVYPENRRIAGRVFLPFEVYNAGKFVKNANIGMTVKIYMNIVCASSRIGKGELFGPQNVGYVEKDITMLPGSVIFETAEVYGEESVTFIPSGITILEWMSKKVPLIKKGADIDLIKTDSEISVAAAATALEDGYFDGKIKVKNLSSGKIVEAKVLSSKEAEAQ